ncbi:DUF4911 domain-containing protein [Desulfovibrio subterraneus]|uniref:DUF4911 domain-containing protein n=1 Tax=Desulfovibrio subterraneus TaxID=2718620 RepID=UPI0022B88419|nr:DUF4911 domain-containing protein [Desulfovibrio subterraneus]WBF66705.1 DUF4911 domain-containing protein [Desulfovibrio subterraneus]
MAKPRPRKPRPPLPAPRWSKMLYATLEPRYIGMFRFLLEAEDNLGYATVVDKYAAVLKIIFSPHQEREMRAFLAGMQQTIPFEVMERPAAQTEAR